MVTSKEAGSDRVGQDVTRNARKSIKKWRNCLAFIIKDVGAIGQLTFASYASRHISIWSYHQDRTPQVPVERIVRSQAAVKGEKVSSYLVQQLLMTDLLLRNGAVVATYNTGLFARRFKRLRMSKVKRCFDVGI